MERVNELLRLLAIEEEIRKQRTKAANEIRKKKLESDKDYRKRYYQQTKEAAQKRMQDPEYKEKYLAKCREKYRRKKEDGNADQGIRDTIKPCESGSEQESKEIHSTSSKDGSCVFGKEASERP